MMYASSSRPADRPINNTQFINPTPYHLRALVLDYLCHSCYTGTARAFVRDSAVRRLDADGDEVMQLDKGLESSPAAEVSEETLRLIEIREQIRIHILSGRVEDATNLLNEHFPYVLNITDDPVKNDLKESHASYGKLEYIAPTSVDPAHLSLNLRILAFIEASRTVPLEYNPRNQSSVPPPQSLSAVPPLHDCDDPETLTQQTELLSRAQKLYAVANMLPNPKDRATYLKELANVGGLLAYKIPEQSSMSKYLSQERREAVAAQINSAILYRTGLPAISHLELYTRYTSTIWNFMHDLHLKPPLVGNRPPGVQLPPSNNKKVDNPSLIKGIDKDALECVPPFDLQQFLDAKT